MELGKSVESDLFLSAAHGNLENIQRLLSNGSVVLDLSMEISRIEFTVQMQALLKEAIQEQNSLIQAKDISIVGITEFGSGLNVALSISAVSDSDVNARKIAEMVSQAKFIQNVDRKLSEAVRTVKWNLKLNQPPRPIVYKIDDKDNIGCTALHWAALNDKVNVMKWLIKEGADLNARGNDGHTPLHWAGLKGFLRATRVLIDAGADLNVQDNWKFTAMIRAAQNGHVLVVLALMYAGADVTICDNEKHNVLHWAVFHRHHLVVEWILTFSSVRRIIDDADDDGCTALHLAAKKSGGEMCRKLIAAGAEISLTDNKGKTPADYAGSSHRLNAARLLRNISIIPKKWRQKMLQNAEHGRTFYTIPTVHGAIAMFFIVLACIIYLRTFLPALWPRLFSLHFIFVLFLPIMYYCYYKSWKGDPGTIPPQPQKILEQVAAEEVSMDDVLLVAMSTKIPRAKFSRFFNCYVARFDHDCPWVSNVVGAKNIGVFVGFCYSVSVCLLCWVIFCFQYLWLRSFAEAQAHCPGVLANSTSLVACPKTGEVMVTILHKDLGMSLLLMIYVFFTFFTILMSFSQTRQICLNVTTNELINWHRYSGWTREDGTFKNPYDRGVIQNLKQFFQSYRSFLREPSKNDEAEDLIVKVDPESSSAYRDSRVKEGYGIEMQTTASQYSKEVEAQLKEIGFD